MTLQSSGYQAAATAVAWASGQDLDSLTDNEWTDLSDAIDNSTNKYVMVDIEIVLGSAAFTGTDSMIEIYLVPSVDGTNYGDWTGNVTTDEQENNKYYVGQVTTSGATAAQRMTLREVKIPPGLYKYGFRSRAGVSLAASGNTVKWRPHSYADA
jgi:hypothetical protein